MQLGVLLDATIFFLKKRLDFKKIFYKRLKSKMFIVEKL